MLNPTIEIDARPTLAVDRDPDRERREDDHRDQDRQDGRGTPAPGLIPAHGGHAVCGRDAMDFRRADRARGRRGGLATALWGLSGGRTVARIAVSVGGDGGSLALFGGFF